MQMRLHDILASKPYPLVRTPLAELVQLGPAQNVAAEELLTTGWALHEFHFSTREAVFIDVGADTNLFDAGFVYQAIMRNAKRMAVLNFDDFIALSQALPAPHKLLHFFNLGHCGSTLVHQVLNASGAALGISEPKFTFDLCVNRNTISLHERHALMSASLKWLQHLPFAKTRPAIVLKHFSHSMRMMQDWAAASPAGNHLFMYRDAAGWCNSRYGFSQRRGISTDMTPEIRHARWTTLTAGEPAATLDGIIDMQSPDLRFEDIMAMCWVVFMRDYQAARNAGVKCLAFSHADLRDCRAATMENIFAWCGLDAAQIKQGMAAFEKDSHEGETTSHDKPVLKLPAESTARIAAILANPRVGLDGNIRL